MSVLAREIVDVHGIMYGQENRLSTVQPLAGRRLRIEYSDGTTYELDLAPLIAHGGTMDLLANDAVFQSAHVASGGDALEFTEGLDFCADSIRVDCELQKAGYPDPWSMDFEEQT
jgi:hypothetical protein